MMRRVGTLIWLSWSFWLAWTLVLALPIAAVEPTVVMRVDTTQTTLGTAVGLELILHYDADMRADEPDLEQRLADFSFRPLERRGPDPVGERSQLIIAGQVRFFELGLQQIPAIDLVFITADGDTLFRRSQALEIEVVSVLGADEQELRDIKPPLEIAGGIALWTALLFALVALALLAALGYWLVRRYRRSRVEGDPEPEPIDFAAEFERIAAMGLLQSGEMKSYYSLLADNLRRFMECELGFESMEETTAEIENSLRVTEIGSDLIRQIVAYLQTADLVKFARFHPDLASARRVPESGLHILRAIEDWLHVQKALAASDEERHAESAL